MSDHVGGILSWHGILFLCLAVSCTACQSGESCTPEDGNGAYSLLSVASRLAHRKVTIHEDASGSSRNMSQANASGTSLLGASDARPAWRSLPGYAGNTGSSVSDPEHLPGYAGNVVITVAAIMCRQSVFAPKGKCPPACPFFAEEEGKPCFFQCVTAAECGSLIPENRVADNQTMTCRPCKVAGCNTCAFGPLDFCAECDNSKGYVLNPEDGTCKNTYLAIWRRVFGALGVLAIFLVVWYIQLACAPITNPKGLREGLVYRSSRKLHIPRGDEIRAGVQERNIRQLWPLSTNLHAAKVAGPGLTLHWNFQLASISWVGFLVICWTIYAYSTYPEQLTVGLVQAQTPPELCSVTNLGRAMQHTMMRAKVVFIVIAYLGTFLGCLAYAVIQRNVYAYIRDDMSMSAYVALCRGLPELSGGEHWEEKLQRSLQDATGEQVVGVSICWNYANNKDDVDDALEAQQLRPSVSVPDLEDGRNLRRKVFGQLDNFFGQMFGFEPTGSKPVEPKSDEEMTELLKSMVSTDSAFIVFETEAARDAAVASVEESGGVIFQDQQLLLQTHVCEPSTVLWDSFDVSTGVFAFRLFLGIICILFALGLWTVVFYLPYAVYSSMFSYSHGEEPRFLESLVFSLVVVAGNQIMYQICDKIAGSVGFRFRDRREGLYILLYFMACTFNVMADMTVEFIIGYKAMVGAHVHTADGRLLQSLSQFDDIFESYPMQKVLGARLYKYCMPSTFFLPFLLEPVFAIFVPYHLCKLLVRTHPEVRGREAEKSMDFFTAMDMSRYGDILLNLMLVSFIFFFPSGSILKLCLAFVACHIFIYFYDQYRVLRAVPAFCYSSDDVDRYAQAIMAIPCATLASCLIFKANCVDGSYCIKGWSLLWACSSGFFCHLVLHYACLFIAVPFFARVHQHVKTDVPFAEAASRLACTWFTANPVHCLRSKHIYGHSPPCSYWMPGKESLMQKNPDIGVYYEDKSLLESEDFDWLSESAASAARKVRRAVPRIYSADTDDMSVTDQ